MATFPSNSPFRQGKIVFFNKQAKVVGLYSGHFCKWNTWLGLAISADHQVLDVVV